MIREDIRNIAIIAHVDHGKTTLVDKLLKQGGIYRENQQVAERVMDNNAIERERGITILSKNASTFYKDVKINIVDTPGHADFGGEVERVLKMVNGVILLVDAAEGPMPQTRFVLKKALDLEHKVIIVINKVDKPDARCSEVIDEILELFIELGATDEQIDSPIIYASGRAGTASLTQDKQDEDMSALFEMIVNYIPAPEGNEQAELQLLVSSIDYNEFVGRIAVGRIERGSIKQNQEIVICNYNNEHDNYKSKVVNIYQFSGTSKEPATHATIGDIVSISGIGNITIGDTITSTADPTPLQFVKIGEPTLEMTFAVNDSPFAGRVGKLVTSRQIKDRLEKELLKDVSLKVRDGITSDAYIVSGRGEMHLSILIETMRREGYEFSVSSPRVIYKDIDGVKHEPIEKLIIDVPEVSVGAVIEKIGARKAEMLSMSALNGRTQLEYLIPSRGLFGYRNEFLTDTRGEGIMNTLFDSYQPFKGEINSHFLGALVAYETGTAVAYGLFNAQARGELFINAGVEVYEGMVVGRSPKIGDINVNVCKRKQLTNTRASGSDDALKLIPPRNLSLEDAIEELHEDELLEVTPESFRIRKQILNNDLRARANSRK